MSAIRQHPGFVAQAAIAAYLIVKPGTSDDTAVPAAAATDLLIGASGGLDVALGDVADVPSAGIGEVRLGGNVTRGQPITADANAKGVLCNPGAGVNHRHIGFALQSGVADDVIRYHVAPGVIQGA